MATTATARIKLGKANMMSLKRMMVNSTPPRKNPATKLNSTPTLSD
jgi:hypothetical protein